MSTEQKSIAETEVKDPVCGMSVNPGTAKHSREHQENRFYFCCAGCADKFSADPQKFLQPRPPATGLVTLGTSIAAKPAPKPKDPVCGMDVNPANAKHKLDHAGKTYYFCSPHCLEKFRADPNKYQKSVPAAHAPVQIAPAAPSKKAPAKAPSYICPMCPEVRESRPVPCPSCGMALEPEIPTIATRTEYTCPMHPEIVRPQPGSARSAGWHWSREPSPRSQKMIPNCGT